LSCSADNRADWGAGAYIESPDTFWSVELVAGYRKKVNAEIID
jgi:hypothetical protein